MDTRPPAHLEVSGLIRATQAAGGFAMVIGKGERDAGTILVVFVQSDGTSKLYERMPQIDGTRAWTLVKAQSPENTQEFDEYLARRKAQDGDLWIVELTIDNGERLVLQS